MITPDLFTVQTTADHVLKLADILDDKANVESANAILCKREGTDPSAHEKRAKNARFYAAACRTLVEENKGMARRLDVRTKRGQFLAPTMQEIRSYAVEIKLPETEATRFYNHFSSNGWKVGGRSAMLDWKAALRNWRMNWAEKNPQIGPLVKHEQDDPPLLKEFFIAMGLPFTPWGILTGTVRTAYFQWVKAKA
jgi:hypothetical protein